MKHRIGNILEEVKTGIILQQVNAQGVMGSGIAKSIREKWPKVWDVYSNIVTPGNYHHTRFSMGKIIPVEVEPGLFVINMVSQQFYGKSGHRYTSYDALDECLGDIGAQNKIDNLEIHHPLIGCVRGGGDWGIVSKIIETHLGPDTTLWTLE